LKKSAGKRLLEKIMRNQMTHAAIAMFGACVLIVACSEEPAATDKNDTGSSSGADTGAADDAVAAADTGSSGGSSSGSSSSSSGADTTVKKADCEDTLACHAVCKTADKACMDACDAAAEAGAKTAHAAISACAVSLCKDVTAGNAAEVGCSFDKCSDKLDACVNFGQGEATCEDTLACLAGCTIGDMTCSLACMQNAAKGSIAAAKKAKTCIDANCLPAPDDKLGQCILDKCSADIAACATKESTCKQLNKCNAHCAESLTIAKNYCTETCGAIASEKARGQLAAYAACKQNKCKGEQNPSACWLNKCVDEQTACFGVGGEINCQEIVQCINKDCEGLGSADQACIEKCVVKGKAWAQDAFIQLEGCFVKNLKSKEATTAGCSYPYDQDTCINVIVGTFCGNQSTNCFTAQ
jgi:hypothetical protein